MLFKTEKTGLSKTQREILSILEYNDVKIISRDEIIRLIRKYNLSSNPSAFVLRLIKNKVLAKFKRKVYYVIPLGKFGGSSILSEYDLVTEYLGNNNYYFGLYSALYHFKLIDQIPNKLFVFNMNYSMNKKIKGYNIRFIKILNKKYFGIIKEAYFYSDMERTLIDTLYYSDIIPLNQALEIFKTARYNFNKIFEYAKKYNSIKLFKLLGYITNNKKLYNYLKTKGLLNKYSTFNNTGKDELIQKWKIRLK